MGPSWARLKGIQRQFKIKLFKIVDCYYGWLISCFLMFLEHDTVGVDVQQPTSPQLPRFTSIDYLITLNYYNRLRSFCVSTRTN